MEINYSSLPAQFVEQCLTSKQKDDLVLKYHIVNGKPENIGTNEYLRGLSTYPIEINKVRYCLSYSRIAKIYFKYKKK
jgi:hypothetical protein